MRLYKLTKQDGTTHNGFPYAVNGNEEHCLPEVTDPKTCSKNVFHAYKSIELAFLLNQIHANIKDPRLWEIEGDVVVEHWDKVGSFRQKIVRELPIPSWVRDNKVRVRFAKMCADAARVAADAAYSAAASSAYAHAAAVYAAYAASDYSAAAAAYAAYDAYAAADYSAAASSAYAHAAAVYYAVHAAADYSAAAAADYSAAAAAAYDAAGIITTDMQKIAELAINQPQTK